MKTKLLFLLAFSMLMSGCSKQDATLPGGFTRTHDDMTGDITITSPLMMPSMNGGMEINKVILESGSSFMYIMFQTNSSSPHYGEVGLIVLFEDGTRLEKPNLDVSCTYYSSSSNTPFNYRSYLILDDELYELFSTKVMKKFRLYIYDVELFARPAEKFVDYVKQIKDMV